MSAHFEISEVVSRGNCSLLHVRGQLDARSSPLLVQKCAELRAAGKSVALNLKAVTFIASSGVGALLSLAEEFRQSPARLRLTNLSPAVESVIQLLNLEQFLHIDPSDAEALTALEG